MGIYILNPKKTRKPDDSLYTGTTLLLPSLSLGFRHEERETHNFSMLTVRPSSAFNSLTQQTCARTPRSTNSLVSPGPKNQLASSKSKSQIIAFIQNHSDPSPSLQGMTPFTSPVLFPSGVFIVTSVIVTSTRARMNTCTQCVHVTNPCTKPKGSKPN